MDRVADGEGGIRLRTQAHPSRAEVADGLVTRGLSDDAVRIQERDDRHERRARGRGHGDQLSGVVDERLLGAAEGCGGSHTLKGRYRAAGVTRVVRRPGPLDLRGVPGRNGRAQTPREPWSVKR